MKWMAHRKMTGSVHDEVMMSWKRADQDDDQSEKSLDLADRTLETGVLPEAKSHECSR